MKSYVRREFGPLNSTIQTIWKNKTKIISAFERDGTKRKAVLKVRTKGRYEALLKRCKQQKVSLPVSCSVLMVTSVSFLNVGFKLMYILA
jgi:hypothetical protein